MIVVMIILIFRNRAATKIKKRHILDDSSNKPSGEEHTYATAADTLDIWSAARRQSPDQGGGADKPRESETLILNTVYGIVRDAANQGGLHM
ncbi:hypothetical protein RRG08_041339 [Elysia crispata]|uniref:Uncharacterized protein n=1 Tax=Elysia crispata TaxID=231223 RepID=A0AAE0YEX4_9GAST|nr:hypothetical protein RRG08_041339 [Elysia crispata]